MAPRLSERLAAKEKAEIQEAMANSIADPSTPTSMPTSSSADQRVSQPHIPQAISGKETAVTGESKRNNAHRLGMTSSRSQAQQITPTSSQSEKEDSVTDTTEDIVDTVAENNILGTPESMASPSQSVDLSNVADDLSTIAANDVSSVQTGRANPQRRAAKNAVGAYRMAEEIIVDEALESEATMDTNMQVSKKRKAGHTTSRRGNVQKHKDSSGQSDAEDQQVTAVVKKKRKLASSPPTKKGSRSKNLRPQSEATSVTIQVADVDEKDEDFSPSVRASRGKVMVQETKKYGLRQRKGPTLQVEDYVLKDEEFTHQAAAKTTKMTSSKAQKIEKVKTKRTLKARGLKKKVLKKKAPLTAKTSVRYPRGTKFTNGYRVKFGLTPWPHERYPSKQACQNVFNVLREHHKKDGVVLELSPELERKKNGAVDMSSLQGPFHAGKEISIDGIVQVIMSQATGNKSASATHQQLKERYPFMVDGKKIVGEVPNYHAMRKASLKKLIGVLKPAGFQKMRAKFIKECMDTIYKANRERLTKAERTAAEQEQAAKAPEFITGLLSFDYLKPLNMQEKFDALVSIRGIGVKTAACLLSFNLQLPVFAVDTHVNRLSKMLGWLPINCHSEDHAFVHLDKRVPHEMKYGLHQAFWWHGGTCARCRGGVSEKSQAFKQTECPIERLIKKRHATKEARLAAQAEKKKSDKAATKPKTLKPKSEPTRFPIAKYTAEQAAELGLKKLVVLVNDAWGIEESNIIHNEHSYWVRAADDEEDAVSDSALSEADTEIEQLDGLTETGALFDDEDEDAGEADDTGDQDDEKLEEGDAEEDVSVEVDADNEEAVSDEDETMEDADDEAGDDEAGD
jgi:endonuclease III